MNVCLSFIGAQSFTISTENTYVRFAIVRFISLAHSSGARATYSHTNTINGNSYWEKRSKQNKETKSMSIIDVIAWCCRCRGCVFYIHTPLSVCVLVVFVHIFFIFFLLIFILAFCISIYWINTSNAFCSIYAWAWMRRGLCVVCALCARISVLQFRRMGYLNEIYCFILFDTIWRGHWIRWRMRCARRAKISRKCDSNNSSSHFINRAIFVKWHFFSGCALLFCHASAFWKLQTKTRITWNCLRWFQLCNCFHLWVVNTKYTLSSRFKMELISIFLILNFIYSPFDMEEVRKRAAETREKPHAIFLNNLAVGSFGQCSFRVNTTNFLKYKTKCGDCRWSIFELNRNRLNHLLVLHFYAPFIQESKNINKIHA